MATSRDGLAHSVSLSYRVLPPDVTRLALSPRRFIAARRGTTLVPRGGVRITYRDSAAGTTRFEVFRQVRVRVRVGGGASRRLRTRLVSGGSFTHHDHAGATTLHFSGRLRGRSLAPGEYVIKAVASIAGHRGPTASARFTVRPR